MEKKHFCVHPGCLPRTKTILIFTIVYVTFYIYTDTIYGKLLFKKRGGGGVEKRDNKCWVHFFLRYIASSV